MRDAAVLVVNGDDGGVCEEIDRDLLACARAGVLGSVSIVACGATAPEMAARCRDAGVGIGLHVDLTEGRAAAGPAVSLTDAGGNFVPDKRAFWRRARRAELDHLDLVREIRAQWERLAALGVAPDHVDGHNHVHAFPQVLEALAEALGEARRGLWLRVPGEVGCAGEQVPEGLRGLDLDALRGRAEALGFRTARGFFGFAFCARPEMAAVDAIARRADGVCEWMTHPGESARSPFRRDPRRARESALLRDPAVRERLVARGLALTTFAEAAS